MRDKTNFTNLLSAISGISGKGKGTQPSAKDIEFIQEICFTDPLTSILACQEGKLYLYLFLYFSRQTLEPFIHILNHQKDILNGIKEKGNSALLKMLTQESVNFFQKYSNENILNSNKIKVTIFLSTIENDMVLDQINIFNLYKQNVIMNPSADNLKVLGSLGAYKDEISKVLQKQSQAPLTRSAYEYLRGEINKKIAKIEKEINVIKNEIPNNAIQTNINLQNTNPPKQTISNKNFEEVKMCVNSQKISEDINNTLVHIQESLLDKDRFIFKDIISYEENHRIEYKMWHVPWEDHIWFKYKRIICSFLNCGGGCLFIGMREIKDRRGQVQVLGVEYGLGTFDTEKNELKHKIIHSFSPNLKTDNSIDTMMKIDFIPVVDEKNSNVHYQSKFVVRIIVKPMHEHQLYMFDHTHFLNNQYPREVIKAVHSFVRVSSSCLQLTAIQIKDIIKEREHNPIKTVDMYKLSTPPCLLSSLKSGKKRLSTLLRNKTVFKFRERKWRILEKIFY